MSTSVRNLLDLNHELILFGYGLVFFILGLTITLQSRRHSRLELARSLGWLSIFGIVHGLSEWALLFVPFQAAYMNHAGASMLQVIQVLLLSLSLAALLQFGVDLVRDIAPWLVRLPPVVTTLWLLWMLATGITTDTGTGLWQQQVSVGARYLLGFPGALLTAYGLRYQATRQIRPLNFDHIYRMLRIAGLAFAAFAVFGGLVVPAADFFPANLFNQSVLNRLLGVPVQVFLSLTGLVMVVTIVRAMEVFDLEIDHLIEQMEIEQSLLAERNRIGRELHDGTIQLVYTAGLIVESARRKIDDDDVLAQRLDRAMSALDEAIASLRNYMSDLRAEPSSLTLREGLARLAADPRLTTLVQVDLLFDLPGAFMLDPIQTTHVLAIVSEALANVVRHSHASQATVAVTCAEKKLSVRIADNGRGFALNGRPGGYGLRNMRDRARMLGGDLNVTSSAGTGTEITVTVPWEDM